VFRHRSLICFDRNADRLPGSIGYDGTRRGDLAGEFANGIIAIPLKFVVDADGVGQLGENFVCLLAVFEPLDRLQDLIQVGRLRRAISANCAISASREAGFAAMRAAASRIASPKADFSSVVCVGFVSIDSFLLARRHEAGP
jgi:hypothetical protein